MRTTLRDVARRLFAPLLALGLGVVLAEGLLRVAGVAYPAWARPTPGLREWGIPHATGWAVSETRSWVELNSIGARDVEHALEKPDDVLRIVVVGDSYTAAFEVAREDAFWAVLQRELNDCRGLQGRRVEVVNISKRGYGTVEELLALRRFGFAYDPDWVVLAFLTRNDFRNNSRALKDSDRPYFEYVDGSLRLDESYADEPDFRRWTGWPGDLWYGLVRWSRLVQAIRQIQRQIEARVEAPDPEADPETAATAGEPGLDDLVYLPPTDPDWRSAWRVTEGVIRMMRDEVRAHGARFLLTTLSNAIQVDPDPEARRAYAAAIGATDLFYPDRRLAAFAEREGIPALTLAPELLDWAKKHDTCLHGFQEPWLCRGHWNAAGHRLAGERLATRLCEEMPSGVER